MLPDNSNQMCDAFQSQISFIRQLFIRANVQKHRERPRTFNVREYFSWLRREYTEQNHCANAGATSSRE